MSLSFAKAFNNLSFRERLLCTLAALCGVALFYALLAPEAVQGFQNKKIQSAVDTPVNNVLTQPIETSDINRADVLKRISEAPVGVEAMHDLSEVIGVEELAIEYLYSESLGSVASEGVLHELFAHHFQIESMMSIAALQRLSDTLAKSLYWQVDKISWSQTSSIMDDDRRADENGVVSIKVRLINHSQHWLAYDGNAGLGSPVRLERFNG